MLERVDCQENVVVYPPNKTLERAIEFSKNPKIYDHLLFIDFNSKGEAILGSSSLDSTLWEGTTFHFNNATTLESLEYHKSYIGSTVSDGKFLTDSTIVLAEDTGIINVLSICEDKPTLQSVNYFSRSGRIPKLAVWSNTNRILCCSGNSVSIWDVTSSITRKPLLNYENYHTEMVNYVDAIQGESNVFVSASTDRKCVLWDARFDNPASILYYNEFCALTSVSCNQQNPNHFAVSTEGGELYLLDRREPQQFISSYSCKNCIIYRVVFGDSNEIAVCGDDNRVIIVNCEDEMKKSYFDNKLHTGIVRGLAWNKATLYSCGFDKQVQKHN